MRWHPATGVGVVVFGNSDEFKATIVATKLLSEVLARTGAPSEYVRPWPATVRAGQAIDEVLRRRAPLASLGSNVIGENVLRDVPDEVRSRRLDVLFLELGPIRAAQPSFAERILTAAHPPELRWRIDCERGALICDIRLMALPEPVVQSLTVLPADTSGRKPRDEVPNVADHVRVLLEAPGPAGL
jgi:hypothetical protein